VTEPESDEVGFVWCGGLGGEQQPWRPVEFDDGFGGSAGHAFSGPDVEGHSRPSPGLDREPGGNERFGGGVFCDAGFVEVSDVLSSDGVRWIEGFNLAENLEFLVAVGVGMIGDGWLHGQQRDHLQQVILKQSRTAPTPS